MYPIWCLLILLFEIFPCILAKLLQLCPTLYDTMDCNPPGSLVHGIPQARTLEWVAMPSSRGSFWPRVWTHILSDEIKVTLGFYGCFLWSSTNVIQLPFMFQLCLPSYIYPAVSSLTLPMSFLYLTYTHLLTHSFCFPHNFSLYIKLSRPLWLFSLCSQYRLLQIFKLKTVDFPRSSFKSGPIIAHWKTDGLTALSLSLAWLSSCVWTWCRDDHPNSLLLQPL